ncbi:MAG TPA: DUF4177 domain-containing protein [Clostridiaceae bacterium]|nr:DUF4177 domain-containing protein [Clostridiaceae bacterium]
MKLYEYKCVHIWGLTKKTTRILNEYGKEGWELVQVVSGWYYFKRVKQV